MSATSGGKICQLCGEGFQLTVVLNQHMKVAHVDNGDYDCGDCPCVFADEQRLKAHQAERHGYVLGSELAAVVAPERETTRWLKCRFCHMEFLNSAMLKSHEKSKHGDELESSEASDEEDEGTEEDDDDGRMSNPCHGRNRNQVDKLLRLSQATLNTCVAYDQNLTTEKLCSALTSHARALRGEERSRFNSGSSGSSQAKPASRMNGHVSSASSGKESSKTKNTGFNHQENLSTSSGAEIQENASDTLNGQRYIEMQTVVQCNEADKQNVTETPPVSDEQNRYSERSDTENESRHNDVVEDSYPVGQTQVSGQQALGTELKGSNRRKLGNSDNQQKGMQQNGVPQPQLPLETYVPSFLDALPADDDEVFTCSLCGADYATQQTLENHKRSNHVEGGRFPCNQCSCVFATRSELVVHGSTHDDQIMTTEESETPDVSQSEEANNSMAVLECESCGQSFLDDLDLALHKIRNHVQDGYPCSSCSCSFMTVNDMQVHEEMFHADTSFNNSFAPMITQVTSLPSEPSTYCDKCEMDFSSESAAKIHQKNSHVVGGYECQYCPTSYGTFIGLNIHVKRKHKERVESNFIQVPQDTYRVPATPTVACELCELMFSSNHELTKHRKERHFANTESHSCNQCSKNFSSQETLNSHIMAIHIDRSPSENSGVRVLQKSSNTSVPCDLCGFGFASAGSVKAHKSRSHMDFGTHCPYCSCCFQSMSGVKSHLAMFHKGAPTPANFVTTSQKTQAPPKASFRQALERQKAPLIVIEDGADDADVDTTIFKCVECDWVLSDATDLQNHRIMFHGFKPQGEVVESRIDAETADGLLMKCSICDLEFSRASEAESHRKRNHVPGGQFPCKLCKCVFDNGGSLHAHEVTKHKSEVTSPTADGKTGTPATCVCSLCGKIFPKRAELNHHKTKAHKRTGLPCQHCTCVFGTRVEYDAHQAEAHRNQKMQTNNKKRRGAPSKKDTSRYVCQYPNCSFRAKIQNGLSAHIQSTHSQGRRTSEDAYECLTCSKAFRTKQALVAHRSVEHENENNIVQIAINNPVTTPEGKFVCHFCSLQFARNKAFVNHVSMFHENDQMTCKDCDPQKAFSNLLGFNRHRNQMHGDHVTPGHNEDQDGNHDLNPVITACTSLQQAYVKPVQPRCELCNRVFFHRRSLWSHRQRSHVVGGDYGCENCNCGFQKQRSLATHTLIYHGKYIDSDLKKREEIRGECDLCGETFINAARGEIHSRKAHKSDGEYACPDCCCRFQKRTELNLHRVKRHGLVLPERNEEKSPPEVLPSPSKSNRRFRMSTENAPSRPTSPHSFGGDDMDVSMPSPTGSPVSLTEGFERNLQTTNGNASGDHHKTQTAVARDHACTECKMRFSELKLLITHQKMRHNHEERRCSICQMSFVSMMVLIDHLEAKHAKEKSTLSLSKPRGTLSLTCTKCDVTFGSKTSLDMHMKKAHVPNGKFRCERCPCIFAAEMELVNHMHSHNLRSKTSAKTNQLSNMGANVTTNSQDLVTTTNEMRDVAEPKRGRGNPRKDYSAFFNNPPPVINLNPVAKKSTSKPGGPPPANSDDQDILGLAFSAAMNDEIPVTTQIATNVYRCTTCGKSDFPSITTLRKHQLECKSQQQSKGSDIAVKKLTAMRCRFCGKIFTLKVSYNDHMKKKHGITVANAAKEPNKIAEIDLEDDTETSPGGTPKTVPYRKPMPKSVAERKSKLNNKIGKDGLVSPPPLDSPPIISAPPTPPPPPPPPKTKWKCSKCKTIFKKEWKWKVHCYVSHGRDASGSLKCDKCPATFSLKLGHYLHVKFAHKAKPKKFKKAKRNKKTKSSVVEIPKLDNLVLVPSENPNETIIEFILPKPADEMKKPAEPSQHPSLDDNTVSADTVSDKSMTLAESASAPQNETETPAQVTVAGNNEETADKSSTMPIDSDVIKPTQEATSTPNNQQSAEPASTVSSTTEVLAAEANPIIAEKVNETAIPSGINETVQSIQGAIQDNEITSTPSVTEKPDTITPQSVPLVQNKAKKLATKSRNKKKKKKKLKRIQKEPYVPEKGFFSSSSLKKREKLINWEEKMHPCKVCAMKFRRTKDLYRHERINHPGALEFLCIQCPSMTSLSKELNHHEEIYHSDFENLKEVLEAMRQKRGVKRKITSIEPSKPKKPKKVNYLDIDSLLASFTMPNNIFEERKGRNENEAEAKRRRRIKNFGIHTCRVCSMMFRSKQGLSCHLKIHAGEKVFTCRTCKVQFRFYTEYMMHRKKHLALQCLADPMRNLFERPAYGTCSECQATFKTNSLAELHMEEVHPYMKFKDMCSQLCNIWQGPGENFDFNLDLLI